MTIPKKIFLILGIAGVASAALFISLFYYKHYVPNSGTQPWCDDLVMTHPGPMHGGPPNPLFNHVSKINLIVALRKDLPNEKKEGEDVFNRQNILQTIVETYRDRFTPKDNRKCGGVWGYGANNQPIYVYDYFDKKEREEASRHIQDDNALTAFIYLDYTPIVFSNFRTPHVLWLSISHFHAGISKKNYEMFPGGVIEINGTRYKWQDHLKQSIKDTLR